MKKYIAIAVILPILAVLTAVYFYNKHISIWGVNVTKDDIKDILITTKNGSYMITDPEYVLEITKEVSKMEKVAKIGGNNVQPGDKPEDYQELLIETKDNETYGGSFWKRDSGIIMEGNGYYWNTDKELFHLMEQSLKDAQLIS